MLNNDFKILVEKYKRYQKNQKIFSILKVVGLVVSAILAYLFLTQFFQKTEPVQKRQAPALQTEANTQTAQTDNNEDNESENSQNNETSPSQDINAHNLQVTTEDASLEQLIQNQEKLKSYSATIAIANYHFSRKEYKEAIEWSIKASKKNKAQARPWIIYAKSKLSEGKVEIAKKALNLYLKKHPSKEAEALLKKLNAI